jgi:hypothetical protein
MTLSKIDREDVREETRCLSDINDRRARLFEPRRKSDERSPIGAIPLKSPIESERWSELTEKTALSRKCKCASRYGRFTFSLKDALKYSVPFQNCRLHCQVIHLASNRSSLSPTKISPCPRLEKSVWAAIHRLG